jgi:hypothetical protein
VEGVFPAAGTTLRFRQDVGTGPNVVDVPLPLAGSSATYVFGSYLAPSWLRDDVTIEQTPTKDDGPRPTGSERLPFIAVLPGGTAPAGGWPVAVYGHGFTRSATDVFLTSVATRRSGWPPSPPRSSATASARAAPGRSPAAARRRRCAPTAGGSIRVTPTPRSAARRARRRLGPLRHWAAATPCGRPSPTS